MSALRGSPPNFAEEQHPLTSFQSATAEITSSILPRPPLRSVTGGFDTVVQSEERFWIRSVDVRLSARQLFDKGCISLASTRCPSTSALLTVALPPLKLSKVPRKHRSRNWSRRSATFSFDDP